MATYYTLQSRGVAKAVHAGTQTADANTTGAATSAGVALATASVGDVINVFKIPRGAKLEEIDVYGAGGGQSVVYDVGYAGGASTFGTITLVAASGAGVKTGRFMGIDSSTLSLSAAANDWLLTFTVSTATSMSGAASFVAQIRYHLD